MNTDDLVERESPVASANEAVTLRRQLDAALLREAELSAEVADLRSRLNPPADTSASAAPQRTMTLSVAGAEVATGAPHASPSVDSRSSVEAKIAFYRSLFAGRNDVFARRWQNPDQGTQGWAPARTGSSNTPREQRAPLSLTDDVVRAHLEGRATIGLYPLLLDDSCRLLACDFDMATWRLDAQAYVEAAAAAGVPVALELSRSGNGAHVWTFFTEPVAASDARALGSALLRQAMAIRGELELESYDRFFPSQDYLSERGFGNLIALPLQGECRREHNTTVFLDPGTLEPVPDQWAYLSSLGRMTPAELHRVVSAQPPLAMGSAARFYRSPTRPEPTPPAVIHAQLSGMLAVRRAGLPPALHASLKHLATLPNPQFHRNQQLRLSNYATPRFIRCYEEDIDSLYLPRGLTDHAAEIVGQAGSRLVIEDRRPVPPAIAFTFTGKLRDDQQHAVDRLSEYELGVLEAPPGAGKTVMACALIARRGVPTLVLVDRRVLLEQWRTQLRSFLGVEAGQIGAGRRRPTGMVDIAMLQTVSRVEQPAALLDGYGLVVVDECHHVPAPTFERALRDVGARWWLGLTATPERADGLAEIMVMQCGPIRRRVADATRAIRRQLQVHRTGLRCDAATEHLTRSEVLALVHETLVESAQRTAQIADDVGQAMQRGRNCLVLSGRTEHVQMLADAFRGQGLDALVLHGRLKPAERRAVYQRLDEDGQLLLVATDRYVGEGFDCPRLDTLFLTFPVAGKSRIIQYVGRILRDHPGKRDAEVHDYVDEAIPMLAAMHRKRLVAYRQIGFSQAAASKSAPGPQLSLMLGADYAGAALAAKRLGPAPRPPIPRPAGGELRLARLDDLA